MTKNIIKEIGIVLLLIIIIVLILGIIFYEYIPNSRIIPTKPQEYELSEEIKNEINLDANVVAEETVKTYRIDSGDLSKYEDTNSYDKGKKNPFAEIAVKNENTTESSNNIANNNINETNQDGKDKFFNTVGK